MTPPILTNPLGSFPEREEFQVGRTIVQVEIPPQVSRSGSIAEANRLFGGIWDAVPEVLFAAARQLPGSSATALDGGLAVHGIWISPDTGSATYEVGESMDLPDGWPELPEDFSVTVARTPDGQLSVFGSEA